MTLFCNLFIERPS